MIQLPRKARTFALSLLTAAAIPSFAAAQARSLNQIAAPANAAVILSAANKALHLSYFDSTWKEIVISPSATVALPCRNGTVAIAFSDGASVRRISLSTGTQYVLFFDDAGQRWDINTLDSLLQGPTSPN
jgi:hypothetical protein